MISRSIAFTDESVLQSSRRRTTERQRVSAPFRRGEASPPHRSSPGGTWGRYNREGDYHELGVIGWATASDYIQHNPDVVAYLLAHGARHNIFSAVAMGEAEVIRELVARTPNDLERRMNGTRMRHAAASGRHQESRR